MTSAGDDWMREIERRQGYDAMAHDKGYGPMTDKGLVHQLRNSRRWPTLGNAAADRIEALEAENARLREENERLREALAEQSMLCTCHESYLSRGMQDPSCPAGEYGDDCRQAIGLPPLCKYTLNAALKGDSND